MIIKVTVDGFQMVVDPEDGGIGRVLASSSSTGSGYDFAREKLFMHLLTTTVRSGMLCVDLGANIGYSTLFMAKLVGAAGRVLALEPDPHNYNLLSQNLTLNNYEAELFPHCIGEESGSVPFWLSKHPNLNSFSQQAHSIKQIQVRSQTLADFCTQHGYPNFIKMDIEGHEREVLDSGYPYFLQNQGETHFLIEVHPKLYGTSNDFAATLDKYYNIGFEVAALVSTPVKDPTPLLSRGYQPEIVLPSDGWIRSLYKGLRREDAISFATGLFDSVIGKKVTRAILLSRS